jgi:hypothetical protein
MTITGLRHMISLNGLHNLADALELSKSPSL